MNKTKTASLGLLLLGTQFLGAQLCHASEGGIGNGTDLYECTNPSSPRYELLDVYEARLRKQTVSTELGTTAEGVLTKMAEQLAKVDSYYAAIVLAESSKVLSDIRALQHGRSITNPVVEAATSPLKPGPDVGRYTNPADCVPKRMIDQDPDPIKTGIRYQADLDLVNAVGEVNLGISVFHEGLYKIVLANQVNTSIGVRKITGLVFSESLGNLESYLIELGAAGVSTYYAADEYAISTDIRQNHLNSRGYGEHHQIHAGVPYQATLATPIDAFGLRFTQIQFDLNHKNQILVANSSGADLEARKSETPKFVANKKAPALTAYWAIRDRQSVLNIVYASQAYGTNGQTFLVLDADRKIQDGQESVALLSNADRTSLQQYFSCWRNRLLQTSVSSSEGLSFASSYDRLMARRHFDSSLLAIELNECKTSANSQSQRKYSKKSIEALSQIYALVNPQLTDESRWVFVALSGRYETCDVHAFSAMAGLMMGASINAARYRCHDFSGYSRTFIGVGAGFEGANVGVAATGQHYTMDTQSSGKNAFWKPISVSGTTWVAGYGHPKDPEDIGEIGSGNLISSTGVGFYGGGGARFVMGIRIQSERDENFWLEGFFRQINDLAMKANSQTFFHP